MFKKVFRIILLLCGMLFGYGVSVILASESVLGRFWNFNSGEKLVLIAACVGLFGIFFFNLYDNLQTLGRKTAVSFEGSISKIPPVEFAGGVVGLVIGLVVAFLISQIIYGIEILKTAYIGTIISVLLYVLLGTEGFTLGRKLAKELNKNSISTLLANLSQTSRPKTKVKAATPKILDTSVIIDGRIADIMKTGFIEGEIVIPEFVLVELRHIADSADSLKRNRGRRGLDILNRIQEEYGIEIYNTDSEKALDDIPEVDVKLLKLAQIMDGMVVTNDFNLNKVAAIKGVGVLNINELTNALKPVVLPGEEMQVFLVKEGKENNQGIAYLDDGTMIVVENGRRYIGKTIETIVTSVLQTSAGRMIFVKPK